MMVEFQKFVNRGSVIDLAVGIIIGAAFTTVVNSLVNDILMPPIGLILGGVDFSNLYINLSGEEYASLAEAQVAGAATINYGIFINALIQFLIVSLATFFLVRGAIRIHAELTDEKEKEEQQTTKSCPYCLSEIGLGATRCPFCTSQLEPA
ncbi:MAG: large conductance mechanosensitive channel protein MscL [Anaerolineales bacterium]|nr:large conductance mechanosensitive channel protein MscL [Anaerolineales bacterium]